MSKKLDEFAYSLCEFYFESNRLADRMNARYEVTGFSVVRLQLLTGRLYSSSILTFSNDWVAWNAGLVVVNFSYYILTVLAIITRTPIWYPDNLSNFINIFSFALYGASFDPVCDSFIWNTGTCRDCWKTLQVTTGWN